MKSEPVAIAEIVRALVLIGGIFGVAVNAEEEAGLVVAAGGVAAGVSIVLSIITRLKVFSRKTVNKIAVRSAAAGVPIVGDPPSGDPPVDVDHGDYA